MNPSPTTAIWVPTEVRLVAVAGDGRVGLLRRHHPQLDRETLALPRAYPVDLQTTTEAALALVSVHGLTAETLRGLGPRLLDGQACVGTIALFVAAITDTGDDLIWLDAGGLDRALATGHLGLVDRALCLAV